VGGSFVPYLESRSVPVQNVDAVPSSSAAANHMCVGVAASEVLCWGINTLGTLGDGTTTQRTSAVGVTDPF
jgi:alpha-tubulin suppressor-like RCC1 family protein